jgi:hypothetical protein
VEPVFEKNFSPKIVTTTYTPDCFPLQQPYFFFLDIHCFPFVGLVAVETGIKKERFPRERQFSN